MSYETDKEHIRSLTFQCGCCDEMFKIKDIKVCPFCGCTHLEKPTVEDFEAFFQTHFSAFKSE